MTALRMTGKKNEGDLSQGEKRKKIKEKGAVKTKVTQEEFGCCSIGWPPITNLAEP